jgi:aspergillopepsin I
MDGASWSISYGDGSTASGTVGTDTVTVGGVTVTGQAVELATSVSSSFQSDPGDGLLGLAFSSINTVTPNQQKTFFDNALSSLASPVFTAALNAKEPGTYDFGFIDKSKYTGSLTYVDVDNSQGFWQFTGSGYKVGSGSFQSYTLSAIADTGTSLLLIDDQVVNDYYSGVSGAQMDPNQGGYTFPCSTTLPDIYLGIGNYQALVPGSGLTYTSIDGSTCFGGIQSNSGIGFSIFGDVFLKAQFTVFDGGKTRLGFAAKPEKP